MVRKRMLIAKRAPCDLKLAQLDCVAKRCFIAEENCVGKAAGKRFALPFDARLGHPEPVSNHALLPIGGIDERGVDFSRNRIRWIYLKDHSKDERLKAQFLTPPLSVKKIPEFLFLSCLLLSGASWIGAGHVFAHRYDGFRLRI